MLAMKTPLEALDDIDPEKILFVQLADCVPFVTTCAPSLS